MELDVRALLGYVRTRTDTLHRAANVLHQSGVRLIWVALDLETGHSDAGCYYDSDHHANPEEPTIDATKIPATTLTARLDHAA